MTGLNFGPYSTDRGPGNAKRRYQSVVCTRCGATRNRGGITVEARADFVCGTCLRKEAKKAAPKPTNRCRFCNKLTINPMYCDDECSGGQTRTAEVTGLSKQRISQLVVLYLKAHPRHSRKQACEAIAAERQPQNTADLGAS